MTRDVRRRDIVCGGCPLGVLSGEGGVRLVVLRLRALLAWMREVDWAEVVAKLGAGRPQPCGHWVSAPFCRLEFGYVSLGELVPQYLLCRTRSHDRWHRYNIPQVLSW